MGKEEYAPLLPGLLDAQLAGAGTPLDTFLAANSNLPGPAANFNLLFALADLLVERARTDGATIWSLLERWSSLPPAEVPANDPREFLPLAAALGHGAIAAALPEFWEPALARLREQARDPRWRTREMVARGLQAIARVRFDDLWYFLFDLVDWGHPLEMRAAAAAVAEPDLLVNRERARGALGLHAEILAKVATAPAEARRTADFKSLRQGLGYTLSVVVAALPETGFALMRAWTGSPDADVRWILRENLKKNRLAKAYPAEVAAVCDRLSTDGSTTLTPPGGER